MKVKKAKKKKKRKDDLPSMRIFSRKEKNKKNSTLWYSNSRRRTRRNFENSSSREINLQLLSASKITYAIPVIFSFTRVLLLVSETFVCNIFNSIRNFDLVA